MNASLESSGCKVQKDSLSLLETFLGDPGPLSATPREQEKANSTLSTQQISLHVSRVFLAVKGALLSPSSTHPTHRSCEREKIHLRTVPETQVKVVTPKGANESWI